MGEINDWNVAAGSNNDPSPDGAPEGMFPSGVNNTMRENMAVLARWNKDINGSVVVAGTDTYTATVNATTGFALYDGYMFCGTFTNAPTGAATLNLTVVATPLGAQPIVGPDGVALTGGEWAAGARVSFKYDGTSFRMDSIDTTYSTATATTEGVAELATQAEADAGTEADKIITPATLAAYSGLSSGAVNNRIINGLPAVNQRGAQVAMSDADYFIDRFKWSQVGVGVVNGDLVSNYIEVDVTTADVSIAAGDLYYISQNIEQNNITDFNLGTASAATVTLSFKHKHVKAGIYCVAFRNSATDRSYVAEYTQSVSDTEETATISLTLDITGTWATGESLGLSVDFVLAAGSTFQGAADTWAAANYLATSSQVNALDSASNYFRIKEVQLELKASASTFEAEDYGVTFSKCQRYYTEDYGRGMAVYGSGTTTVVFNQNFSVAMRIAPTRTLLDTTPSVAFGNVGKVGTASTISGGGATASGSLAVISGFSGITNGLSGGSNQSTSIISYSAEL